MLEFTLTSGQRIRKQKFIPSSARTFSAEVDFVILHAVEANRFWIVPALVLDGRKTLLFKDGVSQWKDLDLEAARQMRQDGLSYAEIAKKLGRTDHHTVMRRLKGEQFSAPKRNYANVSQYENSWDLVGSARPQAAESA